MSSSKKNFIVDPDYEMTEVARERVRLKEERENKDKIEKVLEIIDREFQTELDHRQSQLDLIQQRLNQAQKTLHLLRYVLITSYYNENDKLMSQLEESATSNDELSISNKDRLHPAVKKLLGNGPHDYKLHFTTTPRKKMKHLDHHKDASKYENLHAARTPEINTNTTLDTNTMNSSTIEHVKNDGIKEEFDTGRNRKKSKYRVVVGNISKWIPAHSEEDKSTHKWMVYVRGSKESPDISHFVQKVVFYLHPSYQPNDIIEIRDGPFHLARRGWGEFPLRVRIFFRSPLNKPVDIIHNLKLDKTFTGRQTLGNETVVNLLLYDNENKLGDATTENLFIKQEPSERTDDDFYLNESDSTLDDVKPNYTIPHYDHDYCFSGIKQEIVEVDSHHDLSLPSTSTSTLAHTFMYDHLSEHSYFRGNSSTQVNCPTDFESTSEEQQSDLMYGIRDTEENKDELIEETVLDDVKIPPKQNPQNNFQKFVMSNGTIIAIKKRRRPQESLLKKMFHKKYERQIIIPNTSGAVSILRRTYNKIENVKRPKYEVGENCGSIDYDKYTVEFPSHRFKNVSEALPYLFKRLPLITELVSDLDYRCTYPYAAKTLEEYSKWNIGKRLSSEWFQAKTILKILTSSQLPDSKNWTTKAIIMYARSHGYTPLANYEIFKNKNDPSEEVLNGIANNGIPPSINSIEKRQIIELIEPDILVDVVNCNPEPEPSKISNHKERLVDHNLELACSYVKQALLDVGVILKPEDIIPGVLFNAAERIVLQAALCLAEDLIRKARTNLVHQGNFREETSTIGIEEIQKALSERPQFNVLLKTNIDE